MRVSLTPDRTRLIFGILVAAYGLYALAFIWRTSFVVDGTRYFCLFDDVMGTMRYAKNLANGYGLVWNPGGPRVEEYNNLLWVLYLTIFHLLHIPATIISLPIQIIAAICLAINLIVVKKIADLLTPKFPIVSLGAVFLTAFFLPLNAWGLLGTEVSALTLILSLTVWKLLAGIKAERFSPLPYLALGIATLIRLDMVILFAAIWIYLLIVDSRYRRRHLVWGIATLLVFVGTQTLFRLAYYGDLLPNTYYLNMEGTSFASRLLEGLKTVWGYVNGMGWLSFLAAFSLLLFRRDKLISLLYAMAVQSAYVIYLGGDGWEWWGGMNRYLVIVIPAFFILFCSALERLYLWLNSRIDKSKSPQLAKIGHASLLSVITLLCLLAFYKFNAIRGIDGWGEALLISPTIHVPDNEQNVREALVLQSITTPSTIITTVWSGQLPYFVDRTMVDLLGKTDPVIAHLPPQTVAGFYVNHMKWSYEYSIGQMKPDIVVRLWWQPEDAHPYLSGKYIEVPFDGFSMFLLKGSPNILWDKVERLRVKPT